jgi:hypothetical protein
MSYSYEGIMILLVVGIFGYLWQISNQLSKIETLLRKIAPKE